MQVFSWLYCQCFPTWPRSNAFETIANILAILLQKIQSLLCPSLGVLLLPVALYLRPIPTIAVCYSTFSSSFLKMILPHQTSFCFMRLSLCLFHFGLSNLNKGSEISLLFQSQGDSVWFLGLVSGKIICSAMYGTGTLHERQYCHQRIGFVDSSGTYPHQFKTIHPFLDGNDRIGRLLVTLFLMEKGVLSLPVLYNSYSLRRSRLEYYDLMMLVREKGEYEQWVPFFLTAILETANNAKETIDKLTLLHEKNTVDSGLCPLRSYIK